MRLLLALALILLVQPAFAGDPRWAQATPDRQQWFKSLTVPGTTRLCCDPGDGHPVASRHDVDTDAWYVMWPSGSGTWVQVPSKIIVDQTSIDPVAYLFLLNGEWRCFVRPNTGI